MLSKLLKYEFRATGRIMLPVYALLLVTAGGTSVTGSLMGRYPESTVLSIFRTLFMTLFAFTTFGVLLLTLVLMVYRFYKNLMTDEGYLMFTLPVSRSQLIWSKLIVSMAWGILSAVLARGKARSGSGDGKASKLAMPWFAFIFIGVVAGTYASAFIAAPTMLAVRPKAAPAPVGK